MNILNKPAVRCAAIAIWAIAVACSARAQANADPFNPRYLSSGFKGAPRLTAPAAFGVLAPSKGLFTHKLCTTPVCDTTVTAQLAAGTKDNSCAVVSTDLIFISSNVETIRWTVKAADKDDTATYQFLGGQVPFGALGVLIQDNDDGLAEEKVPVKPSKAAFVMPTQPTADVHEQTVNTKGKKLYKGFKFSIQLQYTPKSGGTGPIPPPVDCDPYDPVIINHGD